MAMLQRSAIAAQAEPLAIDGAHGEGGGQILRTALSLSAITGRPIRIANIRAGRPKPGLAAQHLTAVRAAAQLCGATLAGDALGSTQLDFTPRRPVRAGAYAFDVAAARAGGSAGAATLVLQTVLLPLALAAGDSTVTIEGGTHVPWSPSFDYASEVWRPTLTAMGIDARLELRRWGWWPAGGGTIAAEIHGGWRPSALLRRRRGALIEIRGRAVAANLPAHIAQRMAEQARHRLFAAELHVGEIGAESVAARCPGAGIFLTAAYEGGPAGFTALGERGKPSEVVANEAVDALLTHHRTGASVDSHLCDQLLLPACLADGPSSFTIERVTRHLLTNAWVIEQFGLARMATTPSEDGCLAVTASPLGVTSCEIAS